jgi:hypothetical protein
MVQAPLPRKSVKKIIAKRAKCVACQGSGRQSKGNATCPICSGTGYRK